MRSIQVRFKNIKEKNPNLGGYICFVKAVSRQGFSKDRISRSMKKLLVENHDYQRSDKKELLKQLEVISNASRSTENGHKTGLGN